MDMEILEKLAAASSPEEVQACLDEKGMKLVPSAPEAPGDGPPPLDGPPAEKGPPIEKGPAKPLPFASKQKRAINKAFKKHGGEEEEGGDDADLY